MAAVVVLVLTGLLEFKDGPFIRPHPALWRVVLALAVAYEMALIIILFQVSGFDLDQTPCSAIIYLAGSFPRRCFTGKELC